MPHASSLVLGPVASQEAIKQIGTNGGGYYNTNAAHPFENPTPLSNFLSLLAIFLIPAAFAYTYGVMAGDPREGWVQLSVMTILFVPLVALCILSEQWGNPALADLGVAQQGNMEGKEVRFGAAGSALWAAATTATSSGSVNAMHDSFTPLGTLVPMLLMKFGEVIYGGVGTGVIGMLAYVVVTVFIAGMMVGRTPEYLGKKLGAFEIKMASLVLLLPPMLILIGSALAVLLPEGKSSVFNPGAQGLSEVMYAFTSAVNNNGSAMAGLNAGTPFYNLVLGVLMHLGRYIVLVAALAMAGSLAGKIRTPVSAGTLPTHTPVFVLILTLVVLLLDALTFLPVLALGPIAEHFALYRIAP